MWNDASISASLVNKTYLSARDNRKILQFIVNDPYLVGILIYKIVSSEDGKWMVQLSPSAQTELLKVALSSSWVELSNRLK
jgi:hypothetical protein